MKQILIRHGEILLEDVPAPQAEPGTVLVQVDHSCISIGTEMSGIRASGLPLWQRALKQPQNVKKVLQMVAAQGVSKTMSLVEGSLGTAQPTGYSAAGIVLAIGDGVVDIKLGDRVACGGSQCAYHAEIIRVPRNLIVPIPKEIDFAAACTVTLGAIALQGVRRASPTLGETFVVIGLGILGQLTVQMLRANGCRAIGVDVERTRIDLAKSMGMDFGIHPEDDQDIQQVMRITDGIGADGVIITAASPSDAIASTAFQMCRRKGRVVLVGDVGLNLNRADFYVKELDFFISTSYGPGRYDTRYEDDGLDYPVAYVRWTENRNMSEYLRLIAEGRIKIGNLVSKTYPINQAPAAYNALKAADFKPLMVLLDYPRQENASLSIISIRPRAQPSGSYRIKLAIIGAGSFAKGMHLPNLKVLADKIELRAVMSRTGHNATGTAKQFGAEYATTDYHAVLNDKDVDAVLIATRHHMHGGMVLAALEAGKHVLVEKPLTLNRDELSRINDFYRKDEGQFKPILLTGFNRRFSPYAMRIKGLISNRTNPMIINYRMNVGHIPLDHWVHGKEGGGRNLGEACHIYDLFTFLTDAVVTDISAKHIRPATNYYSAVDNFVATMGFDDGSVATLTYTAMGAKDHPKEVMEIFVDGKVLVLDDYRMLKASGVKLKPFCTKMQDKGQVNELEEFAAAIRKGGEWPIPLWQQVQATTIALNVEEFLISNHGA